MEDIGKKEFLRVFAQVVGRKRRTNDEVFADMEKLWEIDRLEAVKMAFVSIAYAKEGVVYKRDKGRKVLVDVMGLRNLYEGTAMVYWLMSNKPKVFYSNLYQLGVLFGGWKELITVWEFDLKIHDMDLSRCRISQCKMYNILMKAVIDKSYGPEAVKALPNIRRSRVSNTAHRKCRNIIGKYIRSRMPKGVLSTQNRYYKLVKRSYKGVKVRYKRIDLSWIPKSPIEETYDIIMGQASLKFINTKFIKDETAGNKAR